MRDALHAQVNDGGGDGARPSSSSADAAAAARQPLPISKLRGLSPAMRAVLKHRRITTCDQLLHAAARADARARLAREAGLAPDELLALVRRADMARVNGVGTVFGMMLEDLGILDVPGLAGADAADLHARLRAYNQEERIARRSPTPEEVEAWIAQAASLGPLLTY